MPSLLKAKIQGKVQGVSFRYNTKNKAEELGLCGLVRNEADGSVYLEAEGKKESLTELLAWCRRGSNWAEVAGVEYDISENKITRYKKFKIEQ